MINPCMSCGADRNKPAPEHCLDTRNHNDAPPRCEKCGAVLHIWQAADGTLNALCCKTWYTEEG